MTTPTSDNVTLSDMIRSKSIDSLRRDYEYQLVDWAETDTAVRRLANTVLSYGEVEGDSYAVPTIEDIVQTLVSRIERQNEQLQKMITF